MNRKQNDNEKKTVIETRELTTDELERASGGVGALASQLSEALTMSSVATID